MKKALIVLAVFSLLIFPTPVMAQGGCVSEDLSTWTIAWGADYSGGVISSNGTSTSMSVNKALTGVSSVRVTVTTEAPTFGVVFWSSPGGTYYNNEYSGPGGTMEFTAASPDATFFITVGMYGTNYPTSITAIEVCPVALPTPTPSPGDEGGWLGITEVITLPYEFTPIDISTPSAPSLPLPDLLSVPFINQIGSIALTLMALFDQYQVLGIFVILLVAMLITFWLWTYVTGTPSQVTLKVSEGVNAAGQVVNVQDEVLQEGVNYYQDNALCLDRVDPYAHQRYLAAQGKIDSNKRLVSGMKQGAKLFRKAKKDFSGNPFK